jgi:hypothetical protein
VQRYMGFYLYIRQSGVEVDLLREGGTESTVFGVIKRKGEMCRLSFIVKRREGCSGGFEGLKDLYQKSVTECAFL